MERRQFITGIAAAALVADRALVQLADRAHMINCELGAEQIIAEYAPTPTLYYLIMGEWRGLSRSATPEE